MIARPYRNCSIDRFERLAQAALPAEERTKILDELRHRTTARARALERRLEGAPNVSDADHEHRRETPCSATPNRPFADWSTERLSRLVRNCPMTMRGTVQAELDERQTPAMALPGVMNEPAYPTPQPVPNSKPEGPPMSFKRPPTATHTALSEAPTPPFAGAAEAADQGRAEPVDRMLPKTHTQLLDLLDYVNELARANDRVVYELAAYKQPLFHEAVFRDLPGVRHCPDGDEGTAWLAIERLQRSNPPAVPEAIAPWLPVGRDPEREPQPVEILVIHVSAEDARQFLDAGVVDADDILQAQKPLPGLALAECRDVTLRLAKQPAVKAAIAAYIDQHWRVWAEAEKPRRRTIAIYEKLFALQQTIRGDAADRPLQLIWGIGFAQWLRGDVVLDHPLIERPVEISLDERSTIHVQPSEEAEPRLHLRPFEEFELPGVTAFRRQTEAIASDLAVPELSPFQPLSFEPILRAAAQHLDPGARFAPDHATSLDDRVLPRPTETLTITDHWALYAKPRDENLIVRDLAKLKDAVRAADQLPPAVRAFVEEPSDEAPVFDDPWLEQGPPSGGGTGGRGGQDDTFYFPKPFNKEQQAIIRALEKSDGVVVQGPPGTGKTHTIANIICHYLATGKRVLITSKGEAALGVLRGHLPKDIQDLVISLLTTERDGLRQLEQTVGLVASKITQMNAGQLGREIATHRQKIAALDQRIGTIDRELATFAEQHLKPLQLDGGRAMLPEELARSLVEEREAHTWLPDRPGLGPAFEPMVSDAQIAQAREIRRRLGADLVAANVRLPVQEDLPDEADFSLVHRDLAMAARMKSEVRASSIPILASGEPNAMKRLERLIAELKVYFRTCGSVQNTPWARQLEQRLASATPTAANERELIGRRLEELKGLMAKQSATLEAMVELPQGAHAANQLLSAVERGAVGQKAVGMLDFKLQALVKQIMVNGRPVADQRGWQQVLRAVTFQREAEELTNAWQALATLGIPPLGHKRDQSLTGIGAMAEALETVLGIGAKRRTLERERLALFPAGTGEGSGVDTPGAVRVLLERLELVLVRHRLEARRERKSSALERLANASGQCVDRLRALMVDRWGDPEETEDRLVEDYRERVAEIERLRRLQPDIFALKKISASLSEMGAEKWSTLLLAETAPLEQDPWTPGHWRESWTWWRYDAHLRGLDGRQRILQLSKDRTEADDSRRQLFELLVRDSAYLGLKRSLTDLVQSKLAEFLYAISRIGTGRNKSSALWRQAAREALDVASRAVPCWIMPHWRASESLPARLGDFDLVIVDEASQSELMAIPTLMRGRKLLIVGDDKQVSPTAAFIKIRDMEQLKANFLHGKPFATLMLPGISLYNLALAVFPRSRRMLREHFRCVEPIIRFSMQFYATSDGDDPLYPLRVPKPSERLDPPLIAIHVPHGEKSRSQTNRAEADVIVAEIEQLVQNPAMAGRSVGVISLIGSRQAELIQSILLERLGDAPFERHQIACGDSATFQGKERDIMFVSMVECAKTATSKTATMFEQRFNVAFSRARDRMVLVYSVDETRLKPVDLKAKVLRHFRDPMPGSRRGGNDPLTLCQSGFERSVLGRLLDQGYRATPQLRVGAYAIDIVVEGNNDRRLAIELDGDQWHGPDRWQEDLFRQRVLERCGWHFWRCWGSSYHLDPEGCMADLEQQLARMGIEPIGADWSPPIYSAFRTVAIEAYSESTEDAPPIVPVEQSLTDAASTGTALVHPEAATADVVPTSLTEEAVLEINDRFIMAYMDDPNKQLCLTMTANDHRPDVGLVAANHMIFRQFLGAGEEEQIDVQIDGKHREAVIVKIDKAPKVYRTIAPQPYSPPPAA